uniref:Asialoglycoprotein receptor-like 1 n=1 Tax=Amphilophus citrinellus TaxID=61819 RepID=A0A3Q0SIV4_AMPCI
KHNLLGGGNNGTCAEGWVSYQSHCYLLATTSVTWSKAEDLFPHHDYISKIIPVRHNYWIGLVERQHEGQWSWVDGTDLRSTPM